jgi:hypothetical protein
MRYPLLTLGLFGALTACGLDASVNNALNPPVDSKNPVAVLAPTSTTVQIGSVVLIDGRYSYDPQDAALTYAWTLAAKPNGSAAALSSATAPAVSLTADKGGYYTVTLQVTNSGELTSNVAVATIDAVGTGDNHPPVANAGADQTVTAGELAILDGSASYDPDGGNITYQWTLLLTPTDSAITAVSDATGVRGLLYTDEAGTYTARLRVSDGIDTDEDFITVTAN